MEETLCYICYETESPTNPYSDNPCNCKGSMRIHVNCLQRMVSNAKQCKSCNTPYRFPKRYRGGLPLIIGIDKEDKRYIYTLTEHNSRGKIHGLHQEFTLENILTECSFLHHGGKDGLYQEWYENCNIHFQTQYDEYGKFGYCESWHEDGTIEYKIPVYKNKANGLGRSWEVSPLTHLPYLRSIQYYKNHTTHGLMQYFFENNQVAVETMLVNGQKYGRYKRWEKGGVFHDVGCYYNGKKHGLHRTYDKEGNVGECFYYHKDEREGLQQIFINRKRVLEYIDEIEVPETPTNTLEDVTELF